jgi:hypothetical protein
MKYKNIIFNNPKKISFIIFIFLCIVFLCVFVKIKITKIDFFNINAYVYIDYNYKGKIEGDSIDEDVEIYHCYTIYPFTISTDLGNIYLESFNEIYLEKYLNVDAEYYPFTLMELFNNNGKEIKHNLTLFGKKIEYIEYLEISSAGVLKIEVDAYHQYQFNIDGIKGSTFKINYSHAFKDIGFDTKYYRYTVTLDGKITEMESTRYW